MTDYKIGKCRYCRERAEIYCDNRLCESCDSHTVYCSICRNREHDDDPCRHLFKDEHCEWHGAGYDPVDRSMERPLHLLLSAMGEEFARDLKAAIASGRFYTWLVAPMIGGGGMLELNGFKPFRKGVYYGDCLIRLGEADREDLASGYHWLASLYERRTLKANRATIAWIDSWLWPFSPPTSQREGGR